MKTLLLIDANALVHRAFHALPPLTSPSGEPVQAIYGISSILLKVWREERPDYAVAFFDRPEPTFRKQEYAEYKAKRPKAADELISQIILAHELFLKFGIKTFEVPGHEADDLLGTFAERFRNNDLKIIILTGDLDALQLVEDDKIVVKTLRTGVSDTMIYGEEEVLARYGLPPKILPDYKALVGDPSDNIPGVPGVGPKTASDLLKKYGSVENLYKSLKSEPKYEKKFEASKENALLYKKLATINREVPAPEVSLEELSSREPGKDLADYFGALGFQSLVKRVGFAVSAKEKPREETKVIQSPLFETPPAKKIEDVLVLDPESVPPKELASKKLKVGFDLKKAIKIWREKNLPASGPYFDLGIGFWLLDPDFKKYDPVSVFKKFLNREWSGTEEDLKLARRYLEKNIDDAGLRKIFEGIEMPLLSVLAGMEESGIAIRGEVLKSLLLDLNREIELLVKTIYSEAGGKINLNSPKQLSELLFERLKLGDAKTKRTSTGQRSTNVDVLTLLKDAHPVIPRILEYRELFKLKSTYIEPVIELTGRDGRLRTEFIQTGTATGRLSSQNPNLQNIPAIGAALPDSSKDWIRRFRSAFVAAQGYKLAAFDYSQLELRILASVSWDKKMIEAFRQGEDIHAATASTIFGVAIDKISPNLRRLAKTLNFGIVYGMGADAFAKTAGVKREEAKNFIASYFRAFPGIKEWQEEIKNSGRTYGYVKNLNGRRRFVLGITYGMSRVASEAERIAINMPIQSLGADIVKLAMIECGQKLQAEGIGEDRARLLLSIHDELLFEFRDDIIKDATAIVKKVMESAFKLQVPLTINVKSGTNWAALE